MVLLLLSTASFFFFQAEDGIRDLVRSRGLGDVYKRQRVHRQVAEIPQGRPIAGDHQYPWQRVPFGGSLVRMLTLMAVSYTHLTLPTSDLV